MLIYVLLCLFYRNINILCITVNKIYIHMNKFVDLHQNKLRVLEKIPFIHRTFFTKQSQIKSPPKPPITQKNRTCVRFFIFTIFLLTKGKRQHFFLQGNGWSRAESGNCYSCSSGCQIHCFRNRFSI